MSKDWEWKTTSSGILYPEAPPPKPKVGEIRLTAEEPRTPKVTYLPPGEREPEPKAEPRGWFCEVQTGAEVYLVVNGEVVREDIKTRDGLKPGDAVVCPSIFGYFRATVEAFGDGLIASNGHHAGQLEFNIDKRHCWTCSNTINLSGIKKTNRSQT